MLLSNLNAQNHFYRQYTIDDGLPTNYVYGATQDTLGNIWVYTENGICLFDGYSFKTFTTDDGLPNNDVFWMVKDGTGKMWVLTLSGTIAYLNENYEIIELDSLGTSYNLIHFIDGELTFSNGSNYLQLHGNSIKSFPIKDNESEDVFNFPKSEDIHYTINNDGLLYANTDGFPTKTVNFNLKGLNTRQIGKSNSSGKYYFGGTNNEFFFVADDSLKDLRSYQFEDYFGEAIHAHSISYLTNKKIVLETSSGYLFVDSTYTPIKTFIPPNICKQHFMMRYFEDNEGNIWLGSKNGGLFQIPNYAKKTEVLLVPPQSSKFLFKIIETENAIYPISKEGEIYTIKNHHLHLVEKLKLESDLVGAIPLSNQLLWFSDRRNSYFYDSNNKIVKNTKIVQSTRIAKSSGVAKKFEPYGSRNRSIAFNQAKNTVYTVGAPGVLKYNRNTDSLHMLSKKGLSNVMVLDEDDVFFFKNKKLFKEVNNQLELIADTLDKINTMHKVDNLFYLIGTANKGIFLFNEKNISYKQISKVNHVHKFYPYKDNLFVASNEGIVVYKQTAHLKWQEIKRYSTNIGLPGLETLDVVVKNDTVYALTSQGLAVFHMNVNRDDAMPERNLQIQNIQVNGDTLTTWNILKLKRKQNNLTIDYHLQDYASNGSIKYAYQLKPIDKNWRNTNERIAQYADLKPGKYRFNLKATNLIGDEYELNQGLNFNIQKAYWQKWWFIALCILAFSVSMASLIWIYIKSVQAQYKKENKLNQQIAQLKMESLRSQMNPHFIFNALGSIQYYIQDHKIDEADEYLALFAQLMRRYLDSAVENVIKLKDELMLLEEYTELEEMRFETKFITKIEVDPGIYPADEWIPSMLIQPFVENAINHGLQKRESGGLLHIKFWKINEDELVCEISDNGIGVANSKKNKRNGHKSRAMKNVQDRLEVFQNTGIANVKITTSNISKDINYPGTKVKLQFINFNKYEELQLSNN